MMGAPLILAIETSGPHGSVALATRAGALIAEQALDGAGRNASALLPALQAALTVAGARVDAITAVCFSQGPGSFTGLRVAATVARMLQSISGCDVVGVPTLCALARGADGVEASCGRLLVMLDAKAEHAFAAEYRRGTDPETGRPTWREVTAVRMRRVSELLEECDANTLAIGGAAERQRSELQRRGARVGDDQLNTPRARLVADLGAVLLAAGRRTPPHEILPHYVRPPEAEEVYESRRRAARERRGE